jgi:hypothetical protein
VSRAGRGGHAGGQSRRRRSPGKGKRSREGHRRQGREGRMRRALHEWENGETLGATMVEANRRRRSSLQPSTNSPIWNEPSVGSTNRRQRALDKTTVAVPSDFADDARIKSNCSSKLSPTLEPSRTSASNSGSFRSNLRVGFRILERARREDSSHIYTARV